jgi:Protein-L-isoaspartate(D-aspartate) O-methyltransferase (PCMT)
MSGVGPDTLPPVLDVGCRHHRHPIQRTTRSRPTNNGTSSGHGSSSILGVSGYAYGIDIVPELVNLTRTNIRKQDSDLLLPPPAVTTVAVSDRPHDDDDDPSVVDHAVTEEMRNHHANTDPLPESPPSPLPPPPQSTVTIQLGNGYHGLPQYAPFDIIHVGAAAITFPFTLCQQLKVGGLLIVPVHDHDDQQNHPRQHHLNPTKSQTLYKIERLSDKNPPSPPPPLMFNQRTGPTPTNHSTPPPSGVATYEFDHNEYRITPLLGVRYVPLVLE